MARKVKKLAHIPWSSEITEVRAGTLLTYGVDQSEIIKNFSYEEMVFFLLKGRKPTSIEKDLLRAVIVSHASHGITGQSTLAVMEAADCRSDFINAAIGGFSVGAGKFHQGGLRGAMDELIHYETMQPKDVDADIRKRVGARDRIIGYGHRYHTRDPRTAILMDIADSHGLKGTYIRTARLIESILSDLKNLSMNIEAAGGSILLELGVDPRIAHLIILIGRSPMYAAVYLERLAQGRAPFQRIAIYDELDQEINEPSE